MYELTCPGCGEKYTIDAKPQIGRKVSCGKCGLKHIFHDDQLVPFAIDLSSGEALRRIACPTCRSRFLVNKQDAGEYSCITCGALFYVSLNVEFRESDLKPVVFKQISVTETPEKAVVQEESPCPPVPPRPRAADSNSVAQSKQLPSEAFTGFKTELSGEKDLKLPASFPAAIQEAKRKTMASNAPRTIKLQEDTVKDADKKTPPAANTLQDEDLSAQARKKVCDELNKQRSGLNGLLLSIAEKFGDN